MAYTQDNRYFKVDTPLGKDQLILTRLHGEERISALYHFRLEMQGEDSQVDFAALVGQGATVTVELADGSQRYLHGLVARFEQGGRDALFTTYYADLRPALWLLTLSADCRIFQNKTIPEIVKAVLQEHGVTEIKDALTGTYQPREYCVQYNETHFEFVSRLLEEEGIFYFFEHADGRHTLVLADGASAIAPCPGAASVTYGTEGNWVQQNVVTRVAVTESLLPGAFAVDDFSFETPSADLLVKVDGKAQDGGAATRRIYEYPGRYLKKDRGQTLSKLRIEEREAPGRLVTGDSYCRAFLPGYKTTLGNHYRADINGDYLVLAVAHSFEWDHYQNSFEAMPATVPYRPPRVTPKPVIPGTQTAIVVGKQGEEIWTDAYGRIKVQFHWDQLGKKDENSSCFIRVAQGWAGKSYGHFFLPRIGQEVVVSFLEGDPDRPLVTGAVYNAEQTVPYGLPGEQTKSTVKTSSSKGGSGFNEIRFEDKAGSEELYVHAQKDMLVVVENDRTKNVLHDEIVTVKNSRTATIQEADDTLTVAKGNRIVKVDTGNEEHTVQGDFTVTVSGNLTLDVTGDITIKAGKSITLEAGTAGTVKTGTGLSMKAGTSVATEAGTSLSSKAGTTMTVEAGISLTQKASASQTVDGGGMLTLKGGLVKIN
jgi:type VI secretion system secreted protein VgrG